MSERPRDGTKDFAWKWQPHLSPALKVRYRCATMRSTMVRLSVLLSLGLASACIPRNQGAEAQSAPKPEPPDPYAKPEFSQGAEVLEQRVSELTGDYAVAGQYPGTLEDFKALELELVRGKCYVLVLRLGEGASFGPHARRGVAVITAYELEDMVTHDSAIVGPHPLQSKCFY